MGRGKERGVSVLILPFFGGGARDWFQNRV